MKKIPYLLRNDPTMHSIEGGRGEGRGVVLLNQYIQNFMLYFLIYITIIEHLNA